MLNIDASITRNHIVCRVLFPTLPPALAEQVQWERILWTAEWRKRCLEYPHGQHVAPWTGAVRGAGYLRGWERRRRAV